MSAALGRLSEALLVRPRRALALALVALALAGLAASRLELLTDPEDVVSSPALSTLERASDLFGLGERAYVLVEAEEARERDLLRFARALEARLADAPAVAAVEYGLPVSPEEVVERLVLPYGALYFEPEALAYRLSPEGMRATLERQIARLGLLGLGEAEVWVERDPLELHRPLVERVSTLRGSLRFAPDSPFTLSADRRALLVTVVGAQGAGDLAQAKALTAALQGAVAAARAEPWARGLTAHLAGGPLLAAESARIIADDVVRSFTSSVVLALLLLAFGLRLGLHRVALLMLPTLWGVAAGIGLYALLRPSVVAMALGCSATLVGLGVDFTIHLTAAARAARAAGLGPLEAARAAVAETRGPLVLATMTSFGAFLAFLVAEQRFLVDMGLLTACGLLTCLLGALLFVPPLLAALLPDASVTGEPAPTRDLGATALARGCRRRPGLTLASAALASAAAVALLVWRPPGLENDLRDLQARDSAPLAAQARIAETFGGGRDPLVLLIDAPSEEQALAAAQRLDEHLLAMVRDGTLAARNSAAAFLPGPVEQERALAALGALDPARVRADAVRAFEEVGFDPSAYGDYLDGVAAAAALRAPLDLATVRERGLGAAVDRLVTRGADGRGYALVLLQPAGDVWESAERARLVGRVGEALAAAQVDAALSGVPIVSAESAERVASAFSRVSLLTAVGVVLVLLLRFRAALPAAIALTPAALGTLWSGALLGLCGWQLNLMNLGVLPMILALGVDDGIHLVYRHHAGDFDGPGLRATMTGVLLTSLTTMVAFGGLAGSRNVGIASVGVLAAAGMGACLLASVTVVPAALALLDSRRASTLEGHHEPDAGVTA